MVELQSNKKLFNLSVSVQESDFDLNDELDTIKKMNKNFGGLASFLVQVRGIEDSTQALLSLELEHYPDMTEKEILSICTNANDKWNLHAIRVVHRIGKLFPGDNIVLVLVASVHRKEALKAVEFIMDFLKSRVPLWKKENYKRTSSWVDSKKADEDSLSKW